jgi:hypothetical protein
MVDAGKMLAGGGVVEIGDVPAGAVETRENQVATGTLDDLDVLDCRCCYRDTRVTASATRRARNFRP